MPGREVAAGDMPVVLADERLEQALLLRGQSLLRVPADLVDHLGPVAGRGCGHGDPLWRHPACSFRWHAPRSVGHWPRHPCAGPRAKPYRRPPAPPERPSESSEAVTNPSGTQTPSVSMIATSYAQPHRRFLGTLAPVLCSR